MERVELVKQAKKKWQDENEDNEQIPAVLIIEKPTVISDAVWSGSFYNSIK